MMELFFSSRGSRGKKPGWWFQRFFIFIPKFGEDSHFDQYFSNGLVQPPTRKKVFIQNPNHQGVEIESLKQMYLGLLGRFVSVVMIEAPMGRLI